METTKISEDINLHRRRFFGTAATTLLVRRSVAAFWRRYALFRVLALFRESSILAKRLTSY